MKRKVGRIIWDMDRIILELGRIIRILGRIIWEVDRINKEMDRIIICVNHSMRSKIESSWNLDHRSFVYLVVMKRSGTYEKVDCMDDFGIDGARIHGL